MKGGNGTVVSEKAEVLEVTEKEGGRDMKEEKGEIDREIKGRKRERKRKRDEGNISVILSEREFPRVGLLGLSTNF